MTWEPFLLYLNKEYNLLVFSKLKKFSKLNKFMEYK